ncbi:MAG: hypothetical protein ACOYMN_09680 [Roseimicrobium sp.]
MDPLTIAIVGTAVRLIGSWWSQSSNDEAEAEAEPKLAAAAAEEVPALERAAAFRAAGKRLEAKELLDAELAHNPDDANAHAMLAELLPELSDLEGTEKHAREVVRLVESNKDNPNLSTERIHAAMLLIKALYLQQKHSEAEAVCREAIGNCPSDSLLRFDLRSMLGSILSARACVPEAIKLFDELWQELKVSPKPHSPQVLSHVNYLVQGCIHIGELPRAIEVARFLVEMGQVEGGISKEISKDDVQRLISEAWTNIGACYYVLGAKEACIQAHLKAHEARKDWPLPWVNLAQLASELSGPEHGRVCMDYLEKAAPLIAGDPAYAPIWKDIEVFAVASDHGMEILEWMRRKGVLTEWQHRVNQKRLQDRMAFKARANEMELQLGKQKLLRAVLAVCCVFGLLLFAAGGLLSMNIAEGEEMIIKGLQFAGIKVDEVQGKAGHALLLMGAVIGVASGSFVVSGLKAKVR